MYYIVLQLVIANSISNTLFTYIGSKTITGTTYLGCRLDAIKLAIKVGLSCDSAHPHMKPIFSGQHSYIHPFTASSAYPSHKLLITQEILREYL